MTGVEPLDIEPGTALEAGENGRIRNYWVNCVARLASSVLARRHWVLRKQRGCFDFPSNGRLCLRSKHATESPL